MTTFSAHNWIDGTFVSSSKHGRSIDPGTYETIGDYPDGGAAAHSAIEAAKRAFRATAWRDDTDIDAMLPALENALTIFAGQFCRTGSRLLVRSSIYERVRHGLAERLRAVKVGPASDPASDMGPLIDKESVARVDNVVKNAL
ncbi:aldehyde dehydrogenase family protein [Agrobacterium sp. CR_3]